MPTAPTEVLIASYKLIPTRVAPSALCEDEITGLGGCIGINQQPEMPRLVRLAEQVPSDPASPPFTRQTGKSGDAYTAQTVGTWYEVDLHSFAQCQDGSAEMGIHVNAVDRNTAIPATSVNPLYQFTTTPPAAGTADQRVMPWRDGTIRDVEISFELLVKVMRASSPGVAQSHPVLELIDTRSRRNFYITFGAAATIALATRPEDDFSGRDFGVGNAIVSTVFRDNPAFGIRKSGQAFVCNSGTSSGNCNPGNTLFQFRMRPEDFRAVLAKARTLDPNLSPDLADFAIDNFSFNNEVGDSGEIGLILRNYTLSIFAR
jgi:hypothetical protein